VGAQVDPPASSLLFKLLHGVFEGDAEADAKVGLLAEICGSAALGYATHLTQPRAIILVGETAENGKSQVLDLARGLLPASAICSLPAGRMSDERHVVGLKGKLLNASDEFAIASHTFLHGRAISSENAGRTYPRHCGDFCGDFSRRLGTFVSLPFPFGSRRKST
jgi:hypothetical protein